MATTPQTFKKGNQDIRENQATFASFWRLTTWSLATIAILLIVLAYFFT